MTLEELTQLAIECLADAFKRENIPAHVVNAAVTIVLTLDTKQPEP
jgi:hypothetical protein